MMNVSKYFIKTKKLKSKLTKKNCSIIFLFLIYVTIFITLGLGFVATSIYTKFLTIFAPIYIPFLILIIYIQDSIMYKILSKQIWIKSIVVFTLALYSMFALSYAMSLINEIFHIDPKLFPITTVFLTVFYLPVVALKVLMYPVIYIQLLSGFIILGLILKYVFNYNIVSLSETIKSIVIFIIFVIVLSTTSKLLYFFNEKVLKDYTIEVALKSDFSKRHECINLKSSDVTSILFISDDNVLTYSKTTKQLKIKPCQYNHMDENMSNL